MSKKRAIIILVIVVLAMFGLLAIVLLKSPSQNPAPQPSPTTTVDAFAKDRQLVKQLSGEFAAKYFTYTKPDSPEYFASIKPFMTDAFYGETTKLNARYANTPGGIPSSQSQSESVSVTQIDQTGATVTTQIKTTESGNKSFEQTIEIHWVRNGDRWSADSLRITGNTKR